MQLLNHTQSEAMHMSAHQLPSYYQPQWMPFHSFNCFSHVNCNLAHTKILQNSWLALIFLFLSAFITRSMYLPSPSTTNRMQHYVNFHMEYNWFEFKVFLLLDKLPWDCLPYYLPIAGGRIVRCRNLAHNVYFRQQELLYQEHFYYKKYLSGILRDVSKV